MPVDALRPAYVQLDRTAVDLHEAHGRKVGVAPDDNVRDTATQAGVNGYVLIDALRAR